MKLNKVARVHPPKIQDEVDIWIFNWIFFTCHN